MIAFGKRTARWLLGAVLCLTALLGAACAAEAAQVTDTAALTARDGDAALLTDGDESTYTAVSELTVAQADGIGSLYLVFDRPCGAWTLTGNGASAACGAQGYLHEFVDVQALLGTAATSVTLAFPEGTTVGEVYVFASGETPDWVQKWSPPLSEADLLLMTSHADDEQLFFSGLLPYYAGELGLKVQVVYFTSPFSYHERTHELLNGLWTVGVTAYPVFGEFPDLYSESLQGAYDVYAPYGYAEEDFVSFVVETFRRFKPLVVVGHDVNGEYGHGTHRLNAASIITALDLIGDETAYPESAAQYGVWTLPKLYLHLWGENTVTMDWDQPLDAFDGLTAYQVSQQGFQCHKSQHWTWFYRWMYGEDGNQTLASQIETYSPCNYGLYYTTVGADTGKNDLFENITTYTQQELDAQQAAEDASDQTQDETPTDPAPAQEDEPDPAEEDEPAAGGHLVWKLLLTVVLTALLVLLIRLLCRTGRRGRRK